MKEFLISNLVYGAAKATPTTVNTATSPDLLASGAVGIYYFNPSTGKPVLLTAAVTGNIGETLIIFAQGTPTGCIISKTVQPKDIKRLHGAEYTLYTKQVAFLGFNGTSGSLGTGVLADYDDAGVQIISRIAKSEPEEDYTTSSTTVLAADNLITAAGKVSEALNRDGKVNSYVIAPIGGTAVTATGAVTFVKGSAVVSGITGGVTVNTWLTATINPQTGQLVAIATANSILAVYKVIAVGASSITLERPWEGASYTTTVAAFNAAVEEAASASTSVGLALVSNISPYQTFEPLGTGILANATRTISTAPAVGMFPGSGTPDMVRELELEYFINAGFWNTADKYLRQPTSLVANVGYDLYFIDFEVGVSGYAPLASKQTEPYSITLAVQDGTGAGNATIDAIIDSIASASGTPVNLTVPIQTGDLNPSA